MCGFVQEFFPSVGCVGVYALVFAIVLIVGGTVVYLMNRNHEDGTQENIVEYGSPADEEEEDDDGYAVLVTLTMKDGSVYKIFCDSIDERSLSGGSATFSWNGCGLIAIEDGDGNELYNFDSDVEPIEWGIDGVKTWFIEGA